jgi:glutamate/tyrosine decarboxylase-like PLP-dependent enzyme
MRRREIFEHAAEQATRYLDEVGERPVSVPLTPELIDGWRALLGGDLPLRGTAPTWPVDALMRCAADGGVVGSTGPRYFHYVVGGAVPAAVATDWLVAAFDQFAATAAASPAVTLAEEVALDWTMDLLGLRRTGRPLSGAWVTGTTEAHFVALAAARHELYEARGWDVEARGMRGAPPVAVLAGGDAHRSLFAAAQYLGFGREEIIPVDTDDQGRMLPSALAARLAAQPDPAIVCAAGGEINTGSFDPFEPIAEITRQHGSWLHLDLAFGAAAAAAPELAHLTAGIELADSWATDGHKMLQTPYAVGLVLTAHPEAHRAAMTSQAPYTTIGATVPPGLRDGMDWSPGMARRGLGVPAWAALATLGREGIADVVTRCHDHALRLAAALSTDPAIRIANQVVYNQVLIDVRPEAHTVHNAERLVRAVLDEIVADGTCVLGGTRWRGKPMLRASIANHATTGHDIDLAAEAITRAVHRVHTKHGLVPDVVDRMEPWHAHAGVVDC